MSESVSDYPYVIGLHELETAETMHTIGAEENDMEVLGIKRELEKVEADPEKDRYAEVVYGPRYEEFEQKLREHEGELSDNLSGLDYEGVIDELVEVNPTVLKSFLPVELQKRINQRQGSLPSIRYQDPEGTQNALDARTEAAREEVSKYSEETERDIVDYNEIKRNTAVVFAEGYGDLVMVGKDALITEFDD